MGKKWKRLLVQRRKESAAPAAVEAVETEVKVEKKAAPKVEKKVAPKVEKKAEPKADKKAPAKKVAKK